MKELKARARGISPRCELRDNDLYLYGTIGEPYWYEDPEDFITAKQVRKDLATHTGDVLTVHINSPGGDIFESTAIANLLKDSGKTINIVIDGLAASGATVIAMSGDSIAMHDNAVMMVHHAWTFAIGNAADFRKVASDLDVMDEALAVNYRARFKGTEEELQALLSDETFLTASDAVEKGFADEIVESEKVVSEVKVNVEADIDQIVAQIEKRMSALTDTEKPPEPVAIEEPPPEEGEQELKEASNMLANFLRVASQKMKGD